MSRSKSFFLSGFNSVLLSYDRPITKGIVNMIECIVELHKHKGTLKNTKGFSLEKHAVSQVLLILLGSGMFLKIPKCFLYNTTIDFHNIEQ